MKKYGLAVVNIYFIMLFVVVFLGIVTYINIINSIYLIVILCCSLKLSLIIGEYKK